MTFACVFPGQGSQSGGMLAGLNKRIEKGMTAMAVVNVDSLDAAPEVLGREG